jgi:hypothetical protein
MVKSWIGGDVTQRDIFVSLKRDSLPDYPKKKEKKKRKRFASLFRSHQPQKYP